MAKGEKDLLAPRTNQQPPGLERMEAGREGLRRRKCSAS